MVQGCRMLSNRKIKAFIPTLRGQLHESFFFPLSSMKGHLTATISFLNASNHFPLGLPLVLLTPSTMILLPTLPTRHTWWSLLHMVKPFYSTLPHFIPVWSYLNFIQMCSLLTSSISTHIFSNSFFGRVVATAVEFILYRSEERTPYSQISFTPWGWQFFCGCLIKSFKRLNESTSRDVPAFKHT